MRIAQEAIRNAARHSGAHAVSVVLSYAPAVLTLTVRDDGVGFTPDEGPGRRVEGSGIMRMQERARKAGARFSLRSTPGAGTTVTVEVPIAKADA